MVTYLILIPHIFILTSIITILIILRLSLPKLSIEGYRWITGMMVAGLAGYISVNALYLTGFIGDFIEYLYYSYLTRVLVVLNGIIGLLSYPRLMGRLKPRLIPPLFILSIAIPVSVTTAYSYIGAHITYSLLTIQTMIFGFVFWIYMGYLYGIVGRISEAVGLRPAALAYGGAIVFTGVGALYLNVTGSYLYGIASLSVYESYLGLEALMAFIGSLMGYIVVLRFPIFRQTPWHKEVVTGMEGIDREISGRYPLSMLVMGPPGSGRTSLLTKLAATRLKAGDSVGFFAFDDVADHIRELLTEFDVYAASYETDGRLIIVSGLPAPGKVERYSVKIEPQDVSIMFSQVMTTLKSGRKWIIIDSITTIMDEVGSSLGVKLLRTLAAKAKVAGASLWVSYNHTAFPPQTTALVQDCMEGVVELALQERRGKLERLYRAVYVEGVKVSGEWIYFKT